MDAEQFLNESHNRTVTNAIRQTADDFLSQRKERKAEEMRELERSEQDKHISAVSAAAER